MKSRRRRGVWADNTGLVLSTSMVTDGGEHSVYHWNILLMLHRKCLIPLPSFHCLFLKTCSLAAHEVRG